MNKCYLPGNTLVIPVSDGMQRDAAGSTDLSLEGRQQGHHHKHPEHGASSVGADYTVEKGFTNLRNNRQISFMLMNLIHVKEIWPKHINKGRYLTFM